MKTHPPAPWGRPAGGPGGPPVITEDPREQLIMSTDVTAVPGQGVTAHPAPPPPVQMVQLVAIEFVVPPGDEMHMSKMIDLTMLGMLTGRERTLQEFDALLGAAGFRPDRVVDNPTPLSILEAVLEDEG